MIRITELLEKKNIEIQDIIACFEHVKENGDVAVIKFDGQRGENQYTTFITFSAKNKEMIRVDDRDLKSALIKVLNKYVLISSSSPSSPWYITKLNLNCG